MICQTSALRNVIGSNLKNNFAVQVAKGNKEKGQRVKI